MTAATYSCVRATALIVLALVGFAPLAAQTSVQERLPHATFSYAWVMSDSKRAGPLFNKIEDALFELKNGADANFTKLLSKDYQISLWKGSGQVSASVDQIELIVKSCTEPLFYDESETWLEFSWVCHVDKDAPISSVYNFVDSPEMTATFWFKDGKVERIRLMEPLPVPGKPRVAMNALGQYRTAR